MRSPIQSAFMRHALAACLLILLAAVSGVGARKPLPLRQAGHYSMGGNCAHCSYGHFKTSPGDGASGPSDLDTNIKAEEAFFGFWWGC